MNHKKILFLLIILFGALNISFASTVYISNDQSVLLRAEPNPNADVLVELNKNAPVELLKSDLKSGYSFVRTRKSQIGWVRTKFLNENKEDNKQSFFVREWNQVKNFFKKTDQNKNQLTDDVANQSKQIQLLQEKVDALSQSQHNAKFWFVAGAVIALIGVFIGFVLGSKRKRRQGWY